ncbi:hypothetical protein ACQZV8_02665 [Magnetococcales bacterium HHB-1]
MPIEFTETEAQLIDMCTIEEAEALFEWLQNNPEGGINLEKCEHLHTAILQVLIALKPKVTVLPEEKFLAQWAFAHILWPESSESDNNQKKKPETPKKATLNALNAFRSQLQKRKDP